ncbi:19089_t:CDS:1 [Funneliformis geosporum]|nr:19089_t:CDS:1 [Funneliformis geosporum]
MSGALLIFFPPSPPSGWTIPTAESIISRLTKLIELGFELDNKSIVDTLMIYENKLDDYGDIFWSVFSTIRNNESNDSLVAGLFKEAFKPSRGLKKILILTYLKKKSEYSEHIILKIIQESFQKENVNDVEFLIRRKSLIFSPKIYQFIIDAYGNESMLAATCFIDIFSLKLYLYNTTIPLVSQFTIDSINNIFELYKQGIEYKIEYFRRLKAFSSTSIDRLLSNIIG